MRPRRDAYGRLHLSLTLRALPFLPVLNR